MLKWLTYRVGLWRIFWGLCPECNSDAPELDYCQFCHSFRGWRDKTARRDLRIQWAEKMGYDWMCMWA